MLRAYSIGLAPVRIDTLTEITGVELADAWPRRVASSFFRVPGLEAGFALALICLTSRSCQNTRPFRQRRPCAARGVGRFLAAS